MLMLMCVLSFTVFMYENVIMCTYPYIVMLGKNSSVGVLAQKLYDSFIIGFLLSDIYADLSVSVLLGSSTMM